MPPPTRLRRPAVLIAALAILLTTLVAVRPGTARTAKPVAPCPPLGRHHRQAAGRHGRGHDVREGRQRRRRRLRHARRDLHDVGHAGLGRRDAGADLEPAAKKVVGINALGVAPTGATPEFYRGKDMAYPPEYGPLAAVTPGTPGRPDGDARRVRHAVARRGARARDPDGRWLSRSRRSHRPRSRPSSKRIKEWPYSKAVFLPHPGETAGGAARPARSSASPSSPPRCASWSTPSARRWPRARTARRRSSPPTIASTAATSPRSSSAARRRPAA